MCRNLLGFSKLLKKPISIHMKDIYIPFYNLRPYESYGIHKEYNS